MFSLSVLMVAAVVVVVVVVMVAWHFVIPEHFICSCFMCLSTHHAPVGDVGIFFLLFVARSGDAFVCVSSVHVGVCFHMAQAIAMVFLPISSSPFTPGPSLSLFYSHCKVNPLHACETRILVTHRVRFLVK